MLTATPSVTPLAAPVLADIVGGLAAACDLWRGLVRHDPDGRRPVRLVATDAYEAWAIGWTQGQGVRLHDHGPSAGAIVVADGELTEVLPCRGGGEAVERALGPGRVRDLPVGTVHDVVNRSVLPATSLHVYSPPLTTMTYYDPTTLLPVETAAIEPERPALGPSAGADALHPSRRRVLR